MKKTREASAIESKWARENRVKGKQANGAKHRTVISSLLVLAFLSWFNGVNAHHDSLNTPCYGWDGGDVSSP